MFPSWYYDISSNNITFLSAFWHYYHHHHLISSLTVVAQNSCHHINDYVDVLCDHYFFCVLDTCVLCSDGSFDKSLLFLFLFLCKFNHRPLLNQFKVVMFNKTLPSSFWSLGYFSVKCEGWWYLNASTVVFKVFMSDPGDTRDLSTIRGTLNVNKLVKLLIVALLWLKLRLELKRARLGLKTESNLKVSRQ